MLKSNTGLILYTFITVGCSANLWLAMLLARSLTPQTIQWTMLAQRTAFKPSALWSYKPQTEDVPLASSATCGNPTARPYFILLSKM